MRITHQVATQAKLRFPITRGLNSFRFQLNPRSSVHRLTHLNS